MKVPGFIGPAYTLDSLPVDCQDAINIYPEAIESGRGKGGQVAYYDQTPGLKKLLEIGDGPIRCIHVDSIGRIFAVSGNKLFLLSTKVNSRFALKAVSYDEINDIDQSTDVVTSTEEISSTAHGYYTGLKVQVSSSGTLPTGLSADTDYWVIKVDADAFKLASSLDNALDETSIDITGVGTGTLTVSPQIPDDVANVYFKDINFDSDTISKNSHGLYTGVEVKIFASGLIPDGFEEDTSFYIIKSTDNQFQIASSLSDANDGTEVALTDVTDTWKSKLVGADGEFGGDTVLFQTSKGPVRAASMSFGGDGDDSSTVFVDGVQNYLYKDNNNSYSFGALGSLTSASAVFNIDDDITITISENFQTFVGHNIRIATQPDSALFPILSDSENLAVGISQRDTDPFLEIFITLNDGISLTTSQVVEYINNGTISGKTIKDPSDTTSTLRAKLIATGGGTEDLNTALTNTEGTSQYLDAEFTTSTDPDFGYGTVPTAKYIVWSDGFFILNEDGTNKFWVSDLQSFNIDTLSFTSSEGNPDILKALAVINRILYAFNEKTIEIYSDTGNSDFPFERVAGGFIEFGIFAESSLVKINNTLCWLGRSNDGAGVIYSMEGITPIRISTHAIERAIQGYANPSSATGFAYEDRGHFFYVLNFDEATWVYDLKTKLWHQRAYNNGGALERHRAEVHAYAIKQNLHLVGDYDNNKIYHLDPDTYSDDGIEIISQRTCPHLSGNDLVNIFYDSFQLDMEVGVGLASGQGSDPQVILQWSNDGGHTWSDEQWTSAGGQVGGVGEYKTRVIWRRLGRARDRVWRIKMSDPVKRRFIDAYVKLRQGAA